MNNFKTRMDKLHVFILIFLSQIVVYIEFSIKMNSIFAFFLMILILYLYYLISISLHYLICKFVFDVDLKYVVIYPFTYHETIKFNSIKLLYFPEMIKSTMPVNVYLSFKDTPKFNSKLKYVTISGIISKIIGIFILYFIFGNILSIYSLLLILVLVIFQSFVGKNTQWIGSISIYLNNKIDEYILTKSYLKCIPYVKYEQYLMKEETKLHDEILINIIENYCDAIVRESGNLENFNKIINKYIPYLIENKYDKGLNFFIRILYLVYSIGFIGKNNSNQNLIDTSSNFCNLYLTDLDHNKMEYFKKDILLFRSYLNSNTEIDIKLYELKKEVLF